MRMFLSTVEALNGFVTVTYPVDCSYMTTVVGETETNAPPPLSETVLEGAPVRVN